MKKNIILFVLFFYCTLNFAQEKNNSTDLRDSFIGLYHTIPPYPYSYYIIVEKDLTNPDSLIINDSLWATNSSPTCPVDCYEHKVKFNSDSTWFQSLRYYGHFKKTDTIHLFYLMVGSPPTAYNYDAYKIHNAVNINEITLHENYLLISPNPVSDVVYLQSIQHSFTHNEPIVYDIKGQRVNCLFYYIDNHNYRADVSNLDSGIYFLFVQTNQGYLKKKILVNK